jgi:hypothetical protein
MKKVDEFHAALARSDTARARALLDDGIAGTSPSAWCQSGKYER